MNERNASESAETAGDESSELRTPVDPADASEINIPEDGSGSLDGDVESAEP